MALPQDTLSTVWDIIVSKHEDFLQHSLCPDSTDLSFTGLLNLKNKLLYRNTVGYNFWNFQFPLLSYTCHHCCTGPHLRLWLHSKLCRSDTHIKLVSMENEENRSCCCRDRPQRCIFFSQCISTHDQNLKVWYYIRLTGTSCNTRHSS